MPTSLSTPGTWTIGGWAQAVVSINKLPLPYLQRVEVIRNLNTAAGTCSIVASDPNQISYETFGPTDEIEVFFSTMAAPITGRKIWGGFLDVPSSSLQNGQQFTLSGKEYISRLQAQTYSNVFSTPTDIADVLRAIMGSQTDFTFEGIPASMTYQTTNTFSNTYLFDACNQVCNPFSAYFWIDPTTRDFTAQRSDVINLSPDIIKEGLNFFKNSSVQQSSQFLTNNVTLNFPGGSASAQNGTSMVNFGNYQRTASVGSVSSQTAAQNMANGIVANKATPLQTFTLQTLYLPYTDPGEYITVDCPSLGLNANYLVQSIQHNWTPATGIYSTVTVNTLNLDTTLYIANLNQRLQQLENHVYA